MEKTVLGILIITPQNQFMTTKKEDFTFVFLVVLEEDKAEKWKISGKIVIPKPLRSGVEFLTGNWCQLKLWAFDLLRIKLDLIIILILFNTIVSAVS